MQEIEEETDINQVWQNLKQVILEAARESELSKDAKNANHWWDDECSCKRAIHEKNEARGKYLIKKKQEQTWISINKKEQKLIESAEERNKNG